MIFFVVIKILCVFNGPFSIWYEFHPHILMPVIKDSRSVPPWRIPPGQFPPGESPRSILKVCPVIFYQLYTIHGQQNGQIFPVVFCLLPNKTQATYRRILQQVFDRVGDNRLQDVLVHFERAAINAFHLIDENIDMKGCFYHLSSNIWKKFQHFALQQRYNEDQEFALHTRMLCAVAFMPPDNVITRFEEISDLIRDTYLNLYWSVPQKC